MKEYSVWELDAGGHAGNGKTDLRGTALCGLGIYVRTPSIIRSSPADP